MSQIRNQKGHIYVPICTKHASTKKSLFLHVLFMYGHNYFVRLSDVHIILYKFQYLKSLLTFAQTEKKKKNPFNK